MKTHIIYLELLSFPIIDRKHFEPLIGLFSCPHLCIAYCFTICVAPLIDVENIPSFSVSEIIHGVVNNFNSD